MINCKNPKQNRRVALVTGASGGIGRAIATKLGKDGFVVALHYHTNKPDELITQIRSNGDVCEAFQADIAGSGFEVELLDAVNNSMGVPEVLVNCAAIQDVAPLANMARAQFDTMMNTNVGAVFALSREFANRLSEEQRSRAAIVNISSIEASHPAPGHGHYATSKAAVEMLTKSLALEYGHTSMRVNAVAPGLIWRDGLDDDWPEGVARWKNNCPLARVGQPGDIANGVAFLVSDAATFINGIVLTIDGGMGATPGW